MSIFLVAFCLFVIAFHLPLLKTSRQLMLTVANYLFAGLLIPNGQNWAALAWFIVLTYWFLLLIRAKPSYNLLLVLILAALVMFLVVKGHFHPELDQLFLWVGSVDVLRPRVSLWRENIGSWAEAVGISYMLFKFIDALVHQWEGHLEPCDFLAYVNYQLAFFTLLAGPIQRYNQFYRFWNDLDARPADERATLLDWSRLLEGILKMGAIAPLIEHYFLIKNVGPHVEHVDRLLAQFYVFPIYLYVNFSGYTDLAIGSARLLGFQLPENFDRPFASRNLLEFWNRWHMSLTHWGRDLVFMPAYKRVAESAPRLAKPLGYLLLIVSMCVIGLWHGITTSFVLFGLINGIGVAVNQVYADQLRAWLGRPGLRRYLENRWIHAAAWTVTYHFVCFSFLFFIFGPSDALALAQAIAVWVPVIAALGLGIHRIVPGRPWLAIVRDGTWPKLRTGLVPLYSLVFIELSLVSLLLFSLWAFDQPDPEVIYRRF